MKPFAALTVVLLALIALLQLCRLLLGWPIMINSMAVPLWASAVAALVLTAVAVGLGRESRH